ncbi:DNA-3-methyladenine glycosylase family protein [Natronorubrum aibiense]|uniref:DNA-3-methyladenine glycosylase 2 family protein n=1 Tax=Natronorubrum aibiense TaxID=348826 RepID=A0A5P9P457_9EURY|nr:DNA-3-methyladenine glycosylase [Natronorubrum aibiense]QFU82941.1 DNA-3-methyladenine glycosylase 2 family protein [Natronorubrum aibiense]
MADADPDPETVLRADPVMAGVIDRREPHPLESNPNEYERLCVSIINQQLSTASAAAVRERVFDVLGGDVTPEAVLEASRADLLEAGLSRTKADYVENAARAFQERDLTRAGLAGYTNEAVIAELTEITGIGEWTAHMYLMFVLQRPDVLPLGDLAIRRGIESLYNDGAELTRAEMRDVAEPWRPYRSLASRYIWAEYEA